ncbi:class I SAM-dependent methyltransferase [Candidatus Riflebacteria bacterium]
MDDIKSRAENLEMTRQYYEKNADSFFQDTKDLKLDHVYQPFLSLLPAGGRILDAGCGSGRDSLYFKNLGFKVTAFDASKKLVELGTSLLGQQVLHLTFEEISFEEEFDGIWASASLLHVPGKKMPVILQKLEKALKNGAFFFCSYKYGMGEKLTRGRLFNFYNESTFSNLIKKYSRLEIVDIKKTEDSRKERAGEHWLNVTLRKENKSRKP